MEKDWRDRIDPNFLEFLPEFLENLASESARLDSLLEAEDFQGLARIGHNFKGSAGYFGLTELDILARALEIQSKALDKIAVGATIQSWNSLLPEIGIQDADIPPNRP